MFNPGLKVADSDSGISRRPTRTVTSLVNQYKAMKISEPRKRDGHLKETMEKLSKAGVELSAINTDLAEVGTTFIPRLMTIYRLA